MGATPFSRKEPQASSSTASGLKQINSPRAAPTDPTRASSRVKSDPQPDGISSPAPDPKLTSEASQEALVKADPASAIKVERVPTEGDAASVKAETEDLKVDGRQESGEIDKPQLDTQHKREDHMHRGSDQVGSGQRGVGEKGVGVALQPGPELKVKVKVEVKDEAVGSSPVAKPQNKRLRDRCTKSHLSAQSPTSQYSRNFFGLLEISLPAALRTCIRMGMILCHSRELLLLCTHCMLQ